MLYEVILEVELMTSLNSTLSVILEFNLILYPSVPSTCGGSFPIEISGKVCIRFY